jgi:hypothetical protein
VNAYEKHIDGAEKEGATQCVEMSRKLHDQDTMMVEEIEEHVKLMIYQC